jgi:hypothetical protein
MKQRILIAFAGVAILVAALAAPTFAATGGTDRYQIGTTPYTVLVMSGGNTYEHDFVVTTNPCDGTLSITGSTPANSGYYTTETVTGTLTAGVISFTATYDGPYSPGYQWSGSFPVAGGALSGEFTGTVSAGTTTTTTFKNHGDYVSSMGGGSTAAHSCIGMPLKAASAGTSSATDQGAVAGAAAVSSWLAANETRLVATLDAVLGRVSNPTATAAIQKHVDAANAGSTGLGHAATVAHGKSTVAHGKSTVAHGKSTDSHGSSTSVSGPTAGSPTTHPSLPAWAHGRPTSKP